VLVAVLVGCWLAVPLVASAAVTFDGFDISELQHLPIKRLAEIMRRAADGTARHVRALAKAHAERAIVAQRIAADLLSRMEVMLDLGLGYLSLERSTPTLSPGELQRLRLATQVRSNLFGVVYVLDEPSAGLHPVDTEALLVALRRLKSSGNSLFVVEHELDEVLGTASALGRGTTGPVNPADLFRYDAAGN
jgi:excinuclease ABC subunit A